MAEPFTSAQPQRLDLLKGIGQFSSRISECVAVPACAAFYGQAKSKPAYITAILGRLRCCSAQENTYETIRQQRTARVDSFWCLSNSWVQ